MILQSITATEAQSLAADISDHFELEFAYIPGPNISDRLASFIESRLNEMWQTEYRRWKYAYTSSESSSESEASSNQPFCMPEYRR